MSYHYLDFSTCNNVLITFFKHLENPWEVWIKTLTEYIC